jgi:enediyne biosynthesis protein E4
MCTSFIETCELSHRIFGVDKQRWFSPPPDRVGSPVRNGVVLRRTFTRIARIVLALVLLPGLVTGCRPAAEAPPVGPSGSGPANSKAASASSSANELRFESDPGIEAAKIVYDNGSAAGVLSIVESLGGGVAVFDYDLDGRLDLAFPGGGSLQNREVTGLPTRMFRQSVPGKFESVEPVAGLGKPGRFSHGATVADYDSDGFPDLLITGYGGVTLWRNLGEGTWLDGTAEAGLDDQKWSSSAAWGDLTGDGIADLYLAHYVNWSFENHPACESQAGVADVCPPRRFDGLDDTLYFGLGDGRFRDASQEAGLVPQGKGLGVVLADFDRDGDSDIYVANDTVANFYYINQGDGKLVESGLASGVALDDMAGPTGSMGVAVSDFDGDGWLDLWVANYEDELTALYRNLQSGGFLHVSRKAGLGRLGTLYVGFGCVAGDFDLDGDEDVVVANGHVVHHPRNAPIRQQPLYLENGGGGQFTRQIPGGGYFDGAYLGRGLATGDIDRDGRLDLVVVESQGPATLLYGRPSPDGKRSMLVRLIGRTATRDALGAVATLVTSSGEITRSVSGGGSYLSTSELRLHFGRRSGTEPTSLKILWPGGATSELTAADLASAPRDGGGAIVVFEPVQ